MAEYLDYTGLSHYDGKVKDYVLQNFLLRKSYDLTKENVIDADITVESKEWDSTEGKWRFNGDCIITLPRCSTVYIYINVAKKSDAATIEIGPTTYSTDYIFSRVEDSEYITITFNGNYWLNYIKIEELSFIVPTKTSELENDSKYVTADVSGDVLIVNDGTIEFNNE